ncbi:MAG: hypothetical protein JRJ45_01745 [Deltaproteobacteria bacterium]|nr:hypothetical protein [Deltaproteobacteria bacterium]
MKKIDYVGIDHHLNFLSAAVMLKAKSGNCACQYVSAANSVRTSGTCGQSQSRIAHFDNQL